MAARRELIALATRIAGCGVFSLLAFALLAGIASGCSSASSSGGTLPPGQVDVEGPSGEPTPVELPPSSEPAPTGNFPGCPSTREAANAKLTDAADVRTRLVGIYQSCAGGGTNFEVRLDPDSDTRLLWYVLDDRFVRLTFGTGTSGTMDIGECHGAACIIKWSADGSGDVSDPQRDLRVWTDPTAITVTNPSTASVSEWLRVTD